MKKVVAFCFLLVIVSIFIWKGTVGLDPDFGWHIKSGEYLLENGFPTTDPFSYTMPSFPFIDHAWGSSILFAYLYPKVGSFGLSCLFSSLLILSILLVSLLGVEKKNKKIGDTLVEVILSPCFIISIALFSALFFVRAQVFSWFFWSVFLSLFLKKSLWNKYRFFLPLLFLVWVNLHGGFALGIFSLLLYGVGQFFRKSLKPLDVIIIFSSVFATFANPYGIHIWREVFMTISSPLLRTNIEEWRSIIFSSDLIMFCFITFSTISIFRYWKKFPFEQILLFVFLLMQSFISLKNVPFWLLLAVPLTSQSLGYFYKDVRAIPHGKERFEKALYILTGIFLAMLALESFFTLRSAYSVQEQNFYPQKAIEYLRMNNEEGNIYSDYGWGGYLDWKYPEKKVFIDGRMAIWRWDNAPQGELSNAFKTYIMIGKGEDSYKNTFAQFNITTVLLPNKKEGQESGIDKLEKRLFSFLSQLKIINEQNTFNLTKVLESDGWQKVYEDTVSVVYQKPEGD